MFGRIIRNLSKKYTMGRCHLRNFIGICLINMPSGTVRWIPVAKSLLCAWKLYGILLRNCGFEYWLFFSKVSIDRDVYIIVISVVSVQEFTWMCSAFFKVYFAVLVWNVNLDLLNDFSITPSQLRILPRKNKNLPHSCDKIQFWKLGVNVNL